MSESDVIADTFVAHGTIGLRARVRRVKSKSDKSED